jgi:hypothetical protein
LQAQADTSDAEFCGHCSVRALASQAWQAAQVTPLP